MANKQMGGSKPQKPHWDPERLGPKKKSPAHSGRRQATFVWLFYSEVSSGCGVLAGLAWGQGLGAG